MVCVATFGFLSERGRGDNVFSVFGKDIILDTPTGQKITNTLKHLNVF